MAKVFVIRIPRLFGGALWDFARFILRKGKIQLSSLQEGIVMLSIFGAFVEDDATMSSIPYFENRVPYFVQNRGK